MADSVKKIDSLSGSLIDAKMRDLGDSTWCQSVVDEGIPSSEISCSSYSNSSFSSLITSVNSYLSGSSKRLVSVDVISDGLVTPTFYACVTERS